MNSESSASPCVARIQLAYDGSEFHGWQIQPGLRTVQGTLMRAMEKLIPLDGIPAGAGRTDAGVHARGQVSSAPVAGIEAVKRLARALPEMMPEDISIESVTAASTAFHARHSARGRAYSYRMMRQRNPMRRHDHWRLHHAVDVERMAIAANLLLGDHDCTSFCVSASLEEGKTLCRIRRVDLVEQDGSIVFQIAADRFLHSMVRTIMGTLVEIGRGRIEPESMVEILAARDRRAAGPKAPPQGLCLDRVEYEECIEPVTNGE